MSRTLEFDSLFVRVVRGLLSFNHRNNVLIGYKDIKGVTNTKFLLNSLIFQWLLIDKRGRSAVVSSGVILRIGPFSHA